MERTVYFTITRLYNSHYSIKTKNPLFKPLNIDDCLGSALFANMDSLTIIVNSRDCCCLFEIN